MDKTKNQGVVAFEEWMAKWGPFYRGINYILVALKTNQQYKIITGRVELIANTDGHKINNLRIESTNLIAVRQLVPLSSTGFAETTDVLEGKIEIADEKFLLESVQGSPLSYHFSSLYPWWISFGPRRPTISIMGTSRHQLLSPIGDLRELDWELRSIDTPYENVDDLCRELGIPGFLGSSDSCRIDLYAYPIAGIGDTSKIRNGRASVDVWRVTDADTRKVRFNYRSFHNNKVTRRGIAGENCEWTKKGCIVETTIDIEVGDVPAIRGYLSYDNVALHDEWIEDTTKSFNARYIAHQAVERDRNVLHQLLSGSMSSGDKAARQFEKGVALLLHILGFSVSYYGDISKLQEGVDIYAITPRERHLVVECTLDDIDNDNKLSKLAGRTTYLVNKFSESGHGHTVIHSVIVSPRTKDEIKANLTRAGQLRIAVVTRSELDELTKRMAFQPEPDEIYDEFLNLVPDAGNN